MSDQLKDRLARLSPEKLALLSRLAQQERSAAGTQPAPIERRRSPGPAPLSFAQERLWFIAQLDGESGVYNVPLALRVEGPLDAARLDRALVAIAGRHEVLRSTYRAPKGLPEQHVEPVPQRLLCRVDLGALDAPHRETELERWIGVEVARPFDLERGPLWRATLFTAAPRRHVLLLNLHHIVTDAWSQQVLLRELMTLYDAGGATDPLPPLAIQYADYAVWQRQRLSGERLAAELDHHRRRLGDIDAVLRLPTDRPRPAAQTFRGAHLPVAWSAERVAELEAFGQKRRATLFHVVLALFKVLLHRWAPLPRLRVGTPVAGRSRLELEGLIGLFVNTLVQSTEMSGDPSFAVLLERVRDGALDAVAHQDLPFEKLVDALEPRRELAHSPLFQVLFNLEKTPPSASDLAPLAGLELEPVAFTLPIAKFELTLALTASAGRLAGAFEYNTDLFDRTTLERLRAQLVGLTSQVLADPGRRLSTLELLSPGERHQLLRAENDVPSAGPVADTLDGWLSQVAAQRGAAVVLAGAHGQLSLATVEAAAARLAARLRELGIGEEDRVAVLLERRAETLIALWGVLRAGAAYVPLDPEHPAERLRLVLGDAAVAALVHDQESPPAVAVDVAGAAMLSLDDAFRTPRRQPPRRGGTAAGLAYLIYTSGSTGRPKGVQVSHGAVTRFLAAVGERLVPGDDHSLLAVTTPAFDIAVLELFLPALFAGRTVVAERGELVDSRRLLERLVAERITTVQATPAFWELLLAEGFRAAPGFKILCGGEALMPSLATRLLAVGGELWNLYGPTEATVWVAAARIRTVDSGVTVGGALAGSGLLVVDRAARLQPIGVVGELWLYGAGLARGYYRRPGLTAERFVPHPWSASPGERLYRTGDLARRLADGGYELLGRRDHQIKIRGFRVELGEIEAALESQPAVRRAVATLTGAGHQDHQLVAYVSPANGELDAPALLAALRERLPHYMVPGAIVELDALPLNANGKVDRAALPAVGTAVPSLSQRPFVAPQGELEERIAAVWREILGRDQVGRDDNFFDLGGHSLRMAQLRHELRRRLERDVPLIDLFRYPNIAALAAHLEGPVDAKSEPEDELLSRHRRRAEQKRRAMTDRRSRPRRGTQRGKR